MINRHLCCLIEEKSHHDHLIVEVTGVDLHLIVMVFDPKVKFLDDQKTYLGTQLESEIVEGLRFGVLASMDFILSCTYEKEGSNPELVLYKKR